MSLKPLRNQIIGEIVKKKQNGVLMPQKRVYNCIKVVAIGEGANRPASVRVADVVLLAVPGMATIYGDKEYVITNTDNVVAIVEQS